MTDASLDGAEPALGIELSAVAGGTSAFGDSVRITIRNSADAPRYMQRCGTEPLLLLAEFVDGAWTDPVQNFACVAPVLPLAIELAARDSLTVVRFISIPGSLRFVGYASASADLANEQRTRSNSVTKR